MKDSDVGHGGGGYGYRHVVWCGAGSKARNQTMTIVGGREWKSLRTPRLYHTP